MQIIGHYKSQIIIFYSFYVEIYNNFEKLFKSYISMYQDINDCFETDSLNHSAEFNQQSKIQNNQKLINQIQRIQQEKISKKFQQNERLLYSKKYCAYFSDIQKEAQNQISQASQNKYSKIKHKIVDCQFYTPINNIISFKQPKIQIVNHLYNSSILKYEVVIGKFKIHIDLLHSYDESPKSLKVIGSGGFGTIYKINFKNSNLIVKRIQFKTQTILQQKSKDLEQWKIKPNKNDINDTICQYSIYKICSFYKIGPAIYHELGFDIICFTDSIQFYMQECVSVMNNYSMLEHDLKLSLRKLHKLKLIHKDIKPENILFSPQHDRFILSDFGISHSIQQQLGYKTKTYQQGSYAFMGEQMRNFLHNQQKQIDLYHNDLEGLVKTLGEFNEFTTNNLTPKPKLKDKSNWKFQKIHKYYFQIHFVSIVVKNEENEIREFLQNNSNFLEQFLNQYNFLHINPKTLITVLNYFINKYNTIDRLLKFRQLKNNILDPKIEIEFLLRSHDIKISSNLIKQLSPKQLINKIFQKINKPLTRLFFENQLQFSKQNIKHIFKQKQAQIKDAQEMINQVRLFLLSPYLIRTDLKKQKSEIMFAKNLNNYYKSHEKEFTNQDIKLNEELATIIQNSINKLDMNIFISGVKDLLSINKQKKYFIHFYIIQYLVSFQKLNLLMIRYLKQFHIEEEIRNKIHVTNNYQFIRIVAKLAQFYLKSTNYFKSSQYFRQLLQLIKLNPQFSCFLAFCYYGLGKFDKFNSNFQSALLNFQDGLINQMAYNAQDRINIVHYYQQIGLCYFQLQKYEQSEFYLKKGIKVYQDNKIFYHPTLRNICYELAIIYASQFRSECCEMFAKSLMISKKIYGKQSIFTRQIFLEISKYYNLINNLQLCSMYLQYAYVQGDGNYEYKAKYYIQKMNYSKKLQNDKLILQNMNKAIHFSRSLKSNNNIEIGRIICNYALYIRQVKKNILYAIQQYKKAQIYFKQSKQMLCLLYINIGFLYYDQKCFSQALFYLQKSQEMQKPNFNCQVLITISNCHKGRNDQQNAKKNFEKYLQVCRDISRQRNVYIRSFLSKYYQKKQDFSKSIKEQLQCLKLLFPDHKTLLSKTLNKLALFHFRIKKYIKCIYFYKKLLDYIILKLSITYQDVSKCYLYSNYRIKNSPKYQLKHCENMKNSIQSLVSLRQVYNKTRKRQNQTVIRQFISLLQKKPNYRKDQILKSQSINYIVFMKRQLIIRKKLDFKQLNELQLKQVIKKRIKEIE